MGYGDSNKNFRYLRCLSEDMRKAHSARRSQPLVLLYAPLLLAVSGQQEKPSINSGFRKSID